MAALTIQLDDHLLHQAEAYSQKTGRSLAEIVADYLAAFVDQGAAAPRKSLFGSMRGTAEIVGDIVGPLPAEDWDALRS